MSAGERHNFHPADSRAMLDHYQGMQKMLDGDIYYTNKEIGTLNNKIVKYPSPHPEMTTTIRRSQNYSNGIRPCSRREGTSRRQSTTISLCRRKSKI